MSRTVWYISKYAVPYSDLSDGSRGFFLMKEIAKKGLNSIIITSDSNALQNVPLLNQAYYSEQYGNVTVIWIKTAKYSIAKSFRRILSWIDFELKLFLLPKKQLAKPDCIVVSSLSLFTIFNGLFLRKKYGCKLIFEVRDIWPLTLTEEGGFSKFNPLILFLSFVEKIAYAYSDRVVGTMPNLKPHVIRILRKDKPVHCIPMGIDKDSFFATQQSEGSDFEIGIPRNKFIVGYAGTIGISNALDVLFECAELLKEHTNIHFLILGSGDLLPVYKKKYSHLSNISFIPKVSKDLVQSVLNVCDVLYFSVHESSVWQFGQSLNKVIEYMSSGKVIVASYSGYQSMINESNCGSFVPAGDPIALKEELIRYSLLSSTQLADIGRKGKTWVLKNRCYRKLAGEYLELMFDDVSQQ